MTYDSIILDIDGTLWNTTEIVAQAWNKQITENFPQVPLVTADILKGQFGKPMDVIGRNLFGCLTADQQKILLDKCCEGEQEALYNNTKDITYPGVLETIAELSKTYPLFIVSNCQSGYIELVIEKNHLEAYIKDFACFGDQGIPKDENIRLICDRNNLKSPVYVGDTQGDYEACQKAGVPFIWAAYGFGKPEGYVSKVDSFSELKDLK